MRTLEDLRKEVKRVERRKSSCDKPYKYSNRLSKDVIETLKDIDENKNHSIGVEIFAKNDDNIENFERTALQYRGNKISLGETLIKAYNFAASLKSMGYEKGDKIPICVTNIPEFVYLLIGASFIGAEPVVVADWFNKDYLTEIFNDTKSKTLFIDDLSYNVIKDSIDNSNIENLVMFSLEDSFIRDINGNIFNPYKEIDDKFHDMSNKVEKYRKIANQNFYSKDEFEKLGESYNGEILENVDLNSPFTTTFTSGTTSPGRPKGVIHSNRCYVTLGTFFEKDNPTMKGMSYLGEIPTDTHMALSCGIIDTLLCGCIYDCEPFYDKDFFPYAVLINKSNFIPASTGFWGNFCKLLNFDPEWQNVNCPFLAIPIVTGEGASPGEEKFFNITARKHKFGTDKFPFPISPVVFSIGGGTTEGTGVLITVFKSLVEKLPGNMLKKEGLGLTPMSFVIVDVLDENGKYCKLNEPGLLVEKSPCEMIGYTNEEFNKGTRVIAEDGQDYLSLGTYSYKSDNKRVKMKGRMKDNYIMEDGSKFPLYLIEDVVLKDTKNIMSCTVVNVNDGRDIICHVELQPLTKNSRSKIIRSMTERMDKFLPEEIIDNTLIKFRNNKKSFPLDPSGKRSISTLTETGIDDKTYSFEYFYNKSHRLKQNNTKSLKMNIVKKESKK